MLMRRVLFVLSLAGCLAALPVQAQTGVPSNEDAARLERLFDSLASAQSREEAERIEQRIERIWLRSGSATADLMTRRALEAIRREDAAAALTLISAAIDAAPEFAEGYNRRATLLFLEGDVTRALLDLRTVLRLEPRHYDAWTGLGRILEQFGMDAQALDAYRRAYAINPQIEDLKSNIDRLTVVVSGRDI